MAGTPRAKTHSALASPSRVALIDHIRAADDPLDAHQLAHQCQLHVTTVRFHLDALMNAGLITSSTAPSSGRGRPRLLYSPVSQTTPGDDGYVTLSRLLVRALTGAPDLDAADRAERAGYDWAAESMSGTPDAERAHTLHEFAGRINALFTELGFESDFSSTTPDKPDLDITLHSCPFGAIARENPDIVCRIHLGLLRGVLDRLDAGEHHSQIEPWVTPTACRARVSRTADAANRPGVHPTR